MYLAAPGGPDDVGDTELRNQDGGLIGEIVNLNSVFTLRPVDAANPLPEHLPEPGDTASFEYQVCDSDGLCDTATVKLNFTDAEAPTLLDIRQTAPVVFDEGRWQLTSPFQTVIIDLGPAWTANGDTETLLQTIGGALDDDLVELIDPFADGENTVRRILGTEWAYEPTDWTPGQRTLLSRDCDEAGICTEARVIVDLVDVASHDPYRAVPDLGIPVTRPTTINPFLNDAFAANFTAEPELTEVAGRSLDDLPLRLFGGTISVIDNRLRFEPDGQGFGDIMVRYHACQDRLIQLPEREIFRPSCSESFVHLQVRDSNNQADNDQGPLGFRGAGLSEQAAAPGDDELVRLQSRAHLPSCSACPTAARSTSARPTSLAGSPTSPASPAMRCGTPTS